MNRMKKGWRKTGFILIAMLLLLSGCSKGGEKTAADNTEETTQAEDKKDREEDGAKTEANTETGKKEERDEEIKSGSGSAAAPQEKESSGFYVYHASADSSRLVKEKVEAQEITPEAVLKALTDQGVLPEDVKINSLQEGEKDGEKVLDVDFSQEFAAYAGSMGSTGEYMTLGSVCNTFLDAYGCKKIHITVDGGVFETGHNDYPGYLGFHE